MNKKIKRFEKDKKDILDFYVNRYNLILPQNYELKEENEYLKNANKDLSEYNKVLELFLQNNNFKYDRDKEGYLVKKSHYNSLNTNTYYMGLIIKFFDIKEINNTFAGNEYLLTFKKPFNL